MRGPADAAASVVPPLLHVDGLTIGVDRPGGRILPIVDRADLVLPPNRAVGLVGESGSGKTMLCRALIGTLGRRGARVTGGRLLFDGEDLAGASEAAWRRMRGRRIGYVPQSSLAGLNPVLTVETQLVEAIVAARPMPRREATAEAASLLELVRIPRIPQVLGSRAHQLSGGMRQRVMIAGALAQRPRLLIADEPTTALDVTVQKEILLLIRTLRAELGMALILVSHDLGVIEQVCDDVAVMYAGATVEAGPLDAVVGAPRHPYTRALSHSRVDTAVPGQDLDAIPGEPPSVGAWPAGCRFNPRCPLADDACRGGAQPALVPIARQQSACRQADRMAWPPGPPPAVGAEA